MKHIRAFFEGLFARGSAKKAEKNERSSRWRRWETALAGDRLASASTVEGLKRAIEGELTALGCTGEREYDISSMRKGERVELTIKVTLAPGEKPCNGALAQVLAGEAKN